MGREPPRAGLRLRLARLLDSVLALVLALILALASACATTSPAGPRREVAERVSVRAGIDDAITPDEDAKSRAEVRDRIASLLAEPLTADRAVAVALLGNRRFLASLEELGVAQADLVEAGLLRNPVFAGDLVNSTRGNGLGGGLSLTQSLLSALVIPAKRRVAKAQLREAIVRADGEALALARDVRVAHARALAAARGEALRRELAQLAEVADRMAGKQHEAGNLADFDRERFAARLDRARLDLADASLALVVAREELCRLLGLWGADAALRLPEAAPELPAAEAPLVDLEARGIRERLDVSAAQIEVESINLAIGLRRRGIIPEVEVGLTARNEVGDDVGHEWVLGPNLSIELPIFNPGHADLARLGAYLRQAEHELQQRSIDARSQIRVGREALLTARRKVEYLQGTVLPRRERLNARALERYNGMFLGLYDLLEVRAGQSEAESDLAAAIADYWIARADLELAVGGRLDGGS
ncbi:MAG: TolC family protein [Nannocystaceae bacterium]